MEKNCAKCGSVMTEAKIDSHPFRVYRADVKPTAKTMSNISPCYVCSNCGFLELHVEEPEKFK
ncbi:hypothetical protein VBD025_06995 [Virgibacillus flavescens]|uniref:hypothetical protein n=1 Tax=Virgibacillus flavescens TaxID=1611422 RepID=UPI003D32A887